METKKKKKFDQRLLFNEAQMALFTVKAPNARRGRGQDPASVNAYSASSEERKKCIYSVQTRVSAVNSAHLKRVWNLPLHGPLYFKEGAIEVEMQADTKDGIGYGFATVTIHHGDTRMYLTLEGKTIRNLAQMLNAVANSSRSQWRKSSIMS